MNRDIELHGGALDLMQVRFPDAPEPWIDLSTGINPWPYPIDDYPAAAIRHLPTAAEFESCKTAMATSIGAPPESLILAPGSELLIRLLPAVLPAARVCVAKPTYGDHAGAWRTAGASVVEAEDPLQHAGDFDVLVICNPNNPDGRVWPHDRLAAARERMARNGGSLIIDEAYADLRPALSLARSGGSNGLVILRSFGKFFGLAGLRLGAMLAPPALLRSMTELLGVWPVSGPALAIGSQAYHNTGWQQATRDRLAVARTQIDATLQRYGIDVAGGTDLFRFVKVADAERVWLGLAAHGIYVRRFSWSTRHLRLGLPGSENALRRLADALAAL